MPFGPEYARELAKKGPKPDPLEALGAEPEEEAEMPDEDGDEAAAASAFDDFAKAAGFKASPAAYAAFKEAVSACMMKG